MRAIITALFLILFSQSVGAKMLICERYYVASVGDGYTTESNKKVTLVASIEDNILKWQIGNDGTPQSVNGIYFGSTGFSSETVSYDEVNKKLVLRIYNMPPNEQHISWFNC